MCQRPDLGEKDFAAWAEETGTGELRQILFWRWDPLGVYDAFPATADEYDSYVADLLVLTRRGSETEIATHLLEIERSQMGQRFSDDAQLSHVGQLITGWFAESVPLWRERRRRREGHVPRDWGPRR